MVQDKKKAQPERKKTDESLRTERSKTDQALTEAHASVEKTADQVLRRARDKADAVLLTARDKADDHFAQSPVRPVALGTVANERAVADRELEGERASADAMVQYERAEAARILARLLPLEREKTDRTLLTERLSSDAALSNRDNFLGIVSHDLRNLLAGIAVSAAVLSQRAAGAHEGAQILGEAKRIERYVARMSRLIGDLLDVTSIDSGRLAVTPVTGDLTGLLAEALEMFQPMASVKGIALQLEAVQGPLPADIDHDRLLQVLANLISNAMKFTAYGGRIWISAERAGDEVRVSVRDTGSGIPEERLGSLFDRFSQVGKNDHGGLGLGLYISSCIVEAHGGRISVQSRLGEGSNFCFVVPASNL